MNAHVHSCHRGKSHPNNQAEQQGQHEILSNSVGTQSDETRINDRGQTTKEVLLPNHTGPTKASHSFADEIVYPFFPIAATKLRSLPPIRAKDLGQNVIKTEFLLRCLQVWSREPAPVHFMISHHLAFHHRIAACPGWEGSFRATCPAHPHTAASALCHRDG